jgi:hypothetical protein
LQNIFCSSKSGYTHGCAYFTIDIALGGGGGREIDICNLPIITAFLNDLWCHPVWSTNELKDMNMKHQVMEIRRVPLPIQICTSGKKDNGVSFGK